jgi:cytochrome c peroxidase
MMCQPPRPRAANLGLSPAIVRWYCRRRVSSYLVILLLVGAAPVQPSDPQTSGSLLPSNEEPITPIPPAPAADPLRQALGERLFTDYRLSGNGRLACSSCHDIATNGASRNRRDRAPNGSELSFNTPTVFNAALSFRLNWEGRFRTLQAQAEASLTSPDMMATSVEDVLGRLNADPETARQFDAAYGHAADRAGLLDAIATYERSLITPGGRFDRWLAGDGGALSPEEQSGYGLFKSLGCISCHQGVNVGGNLFERPGIFHASTSKRRELERVPSLRNVATTPPYFHDGSAATLGDAVRRMAEAQLNRTLSDQQVDGIVAFLATLTGTYRGAPVVAAPP